MTKTDKMSSYGLYLQSLRVEKGISIEQVAAETRIRAEILRSIEAEDYANLPNDVFVKGFLQSYAQAIGADAGEVLRRFDARRRAQAPVEVLPSVEAPRQARLWLTLAWVLALMAALVGGTFLIYQVVYQKGGTEARQLQTNRENEAAEPAARSTPKAAQPEAKQQEAAHSQTVQMKAAQPEAATPEAAQAEAAQETAASPPASAEEAPQENAAGAKAARYMLEIVCDADTWLKVIVDDAPAEEYYLKPGDRLQLAAKDNYNLLIGNAGGVSLLLDGQPVPVPGKSGEVVNLQLP